VPDGADITVSRTDDPRLLARDGLVNLGFSLQEASELLEDAPDGLSTEDLISHGLKAARP
jgi:Holliday junction DNA helicase RuvA